VVDVKEGDHKGLLGPFGPADLTVQLRKARAASIHASQTIDDSALSVPGRCLAIRGCLQTLGGTFSAIHQSGLSIKFGLSTLQGPGLPILRSPFPVGRGFPTSQHGAIEGIARDVVAHRRLELRAGLVSLVTGSISLVGGSVPLVTGVVSSIRCFISQRAFLVAPHARPIARVADSIALIRCPITLVTRAVAVVTCHIAPVTCCVSMPSSAIALVRDPISLITG
jgi:hypothetical protein